jgi:hypothetical protein
MNANIAANTNNISDLVGDVDKNAADVIINAQNITSNEEDIEENAAAIVDHDHGSGNTTAIEALLNSTLDKSAAAFSAILSKVEFSKASMAVEN